MCITYACFGWNFFCYLLLLICFYVLIISGTGQTAVSGPCDAQYYCTLGATTATPTDGTTGNVCTIGHYCESNTAVPTPCADGNYI